MDPFTFWSVDMWFASIKVETETKRGDSVESSRFF